MIIHDKMVEVIRNALVDYESATGLECQIRYADRLSAVVEVVLELAEDSNRAGKMRYSASARAHQSG